MRVEARDTGKSWNPGTVTSTNPLKVKLDSELSGVSWDEVRPLTEEPEKKAPAGIDAIKQKIMEDAQAMVKAAKDEAVSNLKTAVEGVRFLATLENPSADAFKEAKARVAAAIKAAQEKGVSQEELIEASSAMGSSAKEEAVKKTEAGEDPDEKTKKKEVVVEFDNPAVGEAGKAAAEKAKEDGKTLPEIIKAAAEAAAAVEGASADDIKKVKKVVMATAMEEESSSSSDSDSSNTEVETELAAAEKAKAKREGIAAVFYMGAH